ncbi:hypothetical protein M0R45_016210 [Rubus argutus]|uniref:Uncharacterized protein n=1 Tax=Rubus argutus TaxID=59490 RepID=A0AAW1XRW8_RUBAR
MKPPQIHNPVHKTASSQPTTPKPPDRVAPLRVPRTNPASFTHADAITSPALYAATPLSSIAMPICRPPHHRSTPALSLPSTIVPYFSAMPQSPIFKPASFPSHPAIDAAAAINAQP